MRKEKKKQSTISKVSTETSAKENQQPVIKVDYQKLAEENLRGWQRAKADYENLIKRTRDSIIKTSKTSNKDLVFQLLPIIDNFEHALVVIPKEIKNDSWVQGVLFIRKQLLEVLKVNGVEPIKSKGNKFNPEFHEAVEKTDSKKSSEGIVKEEIVRGYTMNGEVIRPAKVKVGD